MSDFLSLFVHSDYIGWGMLIVGILICGAKSPASYIWIILGYANLVMHAVYYNHFGTVIGAFFFFVVYLYIFFNYQRVLSKTKDLLNAGSSNETKG